MKRGADPNACGGVRDRPLHLASNKGQINIVSALLEADADRLFFKLCTDFENFKQNIGNNILHVPNFKYLENLQVSALALFSTCY